MEAVELFTKELFENLYSTTKTFLGDRKVGSLELPDIRKDDGTAVTTRVYLIQRNKEVTIHILKGEKTSSEVQEDIKNEESEEDFETE